MISFRVEAASTNLDLLDFRFGHALQVVDICALGDLKASHTLILSSCRRVVMLTPDTVLIAAAYVSSQHEIGGERGTSAALSFNISCTLIP